MEGGTIFLVVSELFEAGDGSIPNWGLVEGGQNAEGVDKIGDFFWTIGAFFEFQDSVCYFEEKVIIVIHLFDDFDEVGDEFVPDSIVSCLIEGGTEDGSDG